MLVARARTYLAHGADLPPHEVNHEQSVVAPLVDLLPAARRIDPAAVSDAELLRRLDSLTAFAGPQRAPRVRPCRSATPEERRPDR